jgi:transcriptional regulator
MSGGGERSSCLTAQQLVILHYRAKNVPDAEIARRRGITMRALQMSMARAAEAIRLMQNEFVDAGLDPVELDRMLLPSIN